jgi:YegS/Rv2252/BmrU family lipid kinase
MNQSRRIDMSAPAGISGAPASRESGAPSPGSDPSGEPSRASAARFLVVLNPAAGGGKCGKLAPAALERLRAAHLRFDVVESRHPGHGIQIARDAFAQGYRRFVAMGGDGTACEIVNGLFPAAANQRVTLAFQPLGTGNSFLRDFSTEGLAHATRALVDDRRRPCDLIRLTHAGGVLYSINLLSIGFTADVAALTNRRFKRLGHLGYLLGVLVCLARLRRREFPLQVDADAEIDRRRHLFLTFNNSKFTGGTMMIAPQADTADGLVEYVRWGPIGRLGLIRSLPTLYDGTHVNHPLAARRSVRHVEFHLDAPVDVMVDGEVMTLQPRTLEVLPSALDVMV